MLESCIIPGSDTRLPFDCPTDTFFNPAALEAHAMPHRLPGFLEDSRVCHGVIRV